jgi:hypothetical protein
MKKIIAIAIGTAMLAGCATDPGVSRIDPDDTIAGVDVVNVAKVNSANMVPVWYLDPGAEEGSVIYASGTGLADDLEFAISKAMHSAKVKLGDRVAGQASAKFKQYTSDNRRGATSIAMQKTQSSTMTHYKDVSVNGYTVENTAVFKEGSLYRSYVQLSLNTENVTNTVSTAISAMDEAEAQAAFVEMQ